MDFSYESPAFDEMLPAASERPQQAVRAHYAAYSAWLKAQNLSDLQAKQQEAALFFRRAGITFSVQGGQASGGEGAALERLIPFDLIPRIVPQAEWQYLERGLAQRVRALNAFLADVYGAQEVVRAGLISAQQLAANTQYRPEMRGLLPRGGIYSHISGIDIVRAGQPNGGAAGGSADYFVLEDNLRVPSGVSYMLENRRTMMRLFPQLFAAQSIAPVEHYPDLLLQTLRSVAPAGVDEPTVALLTPGCHNAAYFEHAFLAQQMGVELVEGADLFCQNDFVYMRTTQGRKRVDVIYRRIDDDFLDPQALRADSALGCAGLMAAYRKGRVSLCNAPGTGIADDKSLYPLVPQLIEFFLGEKPILKNVPTWCCAKPQDLQYTLDHLPQLVVKEVHGAGGYGMLVGPAASRAELAAFRAKLQAQPAHYIAQPTLALSTCPTLVEAGIAPRHIDLRPFVLTGLQNGQAHPRMVAGGLTRVALQAGSLVVNSSQGGGTKDTWVQDEE